MKWCNFYSKCKESSQATIRLGTVGLRLIDALVLCPVHPVPSRTRMRKQISNVHVNTLTVWSFLKTDVYTFGDVH